MRKILLVEDDPSLGFVVKDNLEMEGYSIDLCTTGTEGKKAFDANFYDLCVFDVMLPEMDGFALAEYVRNKDADTPIIFLTAKSLKEDRIKGFKVGGDDYLTKPFSIEELVLRMEAILKRSGKKNTLATTSQLSVGLYHFDIKNLKLTCGQTHQELTQREGQLLEMLIAHKNNVVAREKILIDLWGSDDYFKGRSLDVFITRLRKYLNQDPSLKIVNVHGVGFRLDNKI
jgi:DNA-binding response OmpR family regulator